MDFRNISGVYSEPLSTALMVRALNLKVRLFV